MDQTQEVDIVAIYPQKLSICANTWSVTLSVILSTCMCFLFMKINFLLKFFVGVFITGFWGWIVLDEIYYIFLVSTLLPSNENYANLFIYRKQIV